MLAWLVAASIFSAAYRPARQGQKVAYLTVASFVFLAFVLGVLLLGESKHGKPQEAGVRSQESGIRSLCDHGQYLACRSARRAT